MCNCIKEVQEKSLKYLQEKSIDGTTIVELGSEEGLDGVFIPMEKFNGSLVFGESQLYAKFEYRYTNKKKDGSSSFPKKAHLNINFSHCPFCGVPYKKEQDGTEQ